MLAHFGDYYDAASVMRSNKLLLLLSLLSLLLIIIIEHFLMSFLIQIYFNYIVLSLVFQMMDVINYLKRAETWSTGMGEKSWPAAVLHPLYAISLGIICRIGVIICLPTIS